MHWSDYFHEHECPQCLCTWACGAVNCDPKYRRFCPHGELCHVAPDGSWKVAPKTIRKGRGVGALFSTRGITVVSPYQKGDQAVLAEKK